MAAALQLVGNGSLADHPAILALAALGAVALSFAELEAVPERLTRHAHARARHARPRMRAWAARWPMLSRISGPAAG